MIKGYGKFASLALALAIASCACFALSIDNEPVKVTHRNSGPRYDIEDEVDNPKLTPVSESDSAPALISNKPTQEQQDANNQPESDREHSMPLGHVSIRRIFLVPMMRPSRPDWQESGEPGEHNNANPAPQEDSTQPQMFARPFWPFLTPARPSRPEQHPPQHLFGADEASRSPSSPNPHFHRDQDKSESGGEREDSHPPMLARPDQDELSRAHGLLFDPIQMMIDMMQQAINSRPDSTPNFQDLNKEASSRGDSEESLNKPTSDERPKMPGSNDMSDNNKPIKPPTSQNETREDVVEIEGKKYLRKTVINRHVGENIIFMTKRLIFVPLNETDASNEQPIQPTSTTELTPAAPTTTTAVAPVTSDETTTSPASSDTSPESRTSVKPIVEESTTTTTMSTSATNNDDKLDSVSTSTTTEQPSSSTVADESTEATTKAKESWIERATDVIDKAAERLIESSQPSSTTTTTTTEKPTNTS